jgi:hypothetical protein
MNDEKAIIKELRYQTKLLESMVEHMDAAQHSRRQLDPGKQLQALLDIVLSNPMMSQEAREKIKNQLKSMGAFV